MQLLGYILWQQLIASRLEAIASRLQAIAFRLEAITLRLEAITSRLEAIAIKLEAIAITFVPESCPTDRALGRTISLASKTMFSSWATCLFGLTPG